MNVSLVSITKPMINLDSDYPYMTAEELLVYIARVSNPDNQLNHETADKLLAFLIRQNHWSPFDMVNMTVEVKTSRAIAHQILRHWSIKPQEFSQRYAEVVNFEPLQLRQKADKNRQSSSLELCVIDIEQDDMLQDVSISANCARDEDPATQSTKEELYFRVAQHLRNAKHLYNELLSNGVAKECARFVLPLSTQTTMYLNGSVRSWIHYLQQRTDEHAQLEHQWVANSVKDIFKQHFPNIFKALGYE